MAGIQHYVIIIGRLLCSAASSKILENTLDIKLTNRLEFELI
jgi:hypothetical protein